MRINIQQAEVEWYEKNGKYKSRIVNEGIHTFRRYVIGDDCWNKANPGCIEFIEPAMHNDILIKPTEQKP